jgi:hypothetical protein
LGPAWHSIRRAWAELKFKSLSIPLTGGVAILLSGCFKKTGGKRDNNSDAGSGKRNRQRCPTAELHE